MKVSKVTKTSLYFISKLPTCHDPNGCFLMGSKVSVELIVAKYCVFVVIELVALA